MGVAIQKIVQLVIRVGEPGRKSLVGQSLRKQNVMQTIQIAVMIL